MVELNIMEYKKYKNLYPHEHQAISEFYNGGNKEPLAKILTKESSIPLSHGIKAFIADVIMEINKPNRSNKNDRNYALYMEVKELLDNNVSLRLTSNTKDDGATAIVASKHKGMSEETVKEAYRVFNNMEKELKDNY